MNRLKFTVGMPVSFTAVDQKTFSCIFGLGPEPMDGEVIGDIIWTICIIKAVGFWPLLHKIKETVVLLRLGAQGFRPLLHKIEDTIVLALLGRININGESYSKD